MIKRVAELLLNPQGGEKMDSGSDEERIAKIKQKAAVAVSNRARREREDKRRSDRLYVYKFLTVLPFFFFGLYVIGKDVFFSDGRSSSTIPESVASPYPGISDTRYSLCIKLGSEVMRAINVSGHDSAEHLQSYGRWDNECSPKALLAFTDSVGLPATPLQWARLE